MSSASINESRSASEAKVSSWGFNHVFTWTDRPNAHYPPHSHLGLTTHLIRRGSLTITYPDDEKPTKETFGVGARLDVAAGRRHEVWVGKEGFSQRHYEFGEGIDGRTLRGQATAETKM
ncbi:uncharacterized protein AB675_8892 [Cyphellophora attinorum]|uniref:Cupin 2 conserved barrel domain-containing protein n=1 Tax=Cyphellophora attinorum TaxID=1664694 RepID=A0A0N1H4G1_9EURO|nr:uncharacterized protein AB675_8892 [Phialophora attinorum]KPI36134.1 hypothetical protein AB675_8892 [Phialophora attinorum]